MEENYNESGEVCEAPSRAKRFRIWLDNYIYHYKWHTIIALFLVFTLTVCSVQMCDKESYDVYVVYAGDYQVSKLVTNGDVAEFVTFSKSLNRAAGDYNEDGKVTVSLDTLYLLTADQIKETNDKLKEEGSDKEVQTQLISQNFKTMNDRMLYSEYYVCIMSEEIFKHYSAKADHMFADLTKYVNEGTDVEYIDGGKDTTAIYLNSTGFKNLPVLYNLPDNTVIALRGFSEVSNTFNADDNRENYRRAEEFIRGMVNYAK